MHRHFLPTIILLLIMNPAASAGIIVKVDDLELDPSGRGRVEVIASSDGSAAVPQIDNFALRLRIVSPADTGGARLRFVDDGEPVRVRNEDPRHLFSGTTPIIFDASIFDDDQQFEVFDSVGFTSVSATLDQPQVLTAFSVALEPSLLVGNPLFSIAVDVDETFFTDQNFDFVPVSEIQFESGDIRTSAVPEPTTAGLAAMVTALISILKRRRYGAIG